MIKDLISKHVDKYSVPFSRDSRAFFAPGRVNLIGEHIDYNGGKVFPCALNLGTYGICSFNDVQLIRLYSDNFSCEGIREFGISRVDFDISYGWCNYFNAVAAEFFKMGYEFDKGLDIYIYGNIPNGAGLSSSASIELVFATMLNGIFGFDLSMLELVMLAQRAENDFIGVKCGVMDQFAIAMGKSDHAILLDTNTLSYEYAPLNLGPHEILIVNSNKRRGLADTKYNERRSECDKALSVIKSNKSIHALADLTPEDFDGLGDLIKDDTLFRRAKHVVYENYRTQKAYSCLINNDLDGFGKLMKESHESLRYDYEVSCDELDLLVELAVGNQGVLGSRMTGAGFGGCTVNLVKSESVESLIKEMGNRYYSITGLKADFYRAVAGDGAKEIR